MGGVATSLRQNARRPQALSRILAVRMTLTALLVLLVLLVAQLAYYFVHLPQLRQAILRSEVAAVATELEQGRDPTQLDLYGRFPTAYGFRAFDRRAPALRRVIAVVNPNLLPSLEHQALAEDGDLQSWFGRIPAPAGRTTGRGWMLTARVQERERHYWVQAVMFGDPAGGWVWIILRKLAADALVPVLVMTPTLTLAMFLTTRAALRPLSVVAHEASNIGDATARGLAAEPLPEAGLPGEIADVVAAINRMLSRLQQSQDQQRQFTSDVAHELRTPLAVLLLEIGQLAPGSTQQHLTEELLALSKLIDEMLRFAQAEDLLMQERLPVDVTAVVRHVCEDLAPVALRRGQEIELFGAEVAPVVPGSPPLVEIAVRNVVENAIKYSPPGSAVSVTIGHTPHVVVEDRGPGIAAQQASRIYERFWRASRRGVGGSGVGLALVQRVVQLHDGEIRFENRPGGGARFTLSFAPLRAA